MIVSREPSIELIFKNPVLIMIIVYSRGKEHYYVSIKRDFFFKAINTEVCCCGRRSFTPVSLEGHRRLHRQVVTGCNLRTPKTSNPRGIIRGKWLRNQDDASKKKQVKTQNDCVSQTLTHL